ncbi:MAG TPA: hypothetical protein VIL20_16985 [Sandaracinaceae bacterium]
MPPSAKEPRGLPGGPIPPAIVLVLCATLFVVAWLDPELVDLGPHVSAAGLGVLGSAVALFWLLAAIGARGPR